MKMTLEAKIIAKHGDETHVAVQIGNEHVKENLIPLFYIAMLKAMRDAHTLDFYKALNFFAEEDMDEMYDFFEGGEDDD